MQVCLALRVGGAASGVAYGGSKPFDVSIWLLFSWLGVPFVHVGVDCGSCGRFLLHGQEAGPSSCIGVVFGCIHNLMRLAPPVALSVSIWSSL